MISMKSTLRDIYAHPVGRDILDKILMQMGRSAKWITNPLVASLRLSTLKMRFGSKLGDDIFDTLIELLNSEPDRPRTDKVPDTPKWWKEAVFYQIYPISFQDSDGDGLGDLQGIIQRLDILQELGIDALWLCPVYDSPLDDNGYDIRNYRAIHEQFGGLEDMDELIAAVHARGMRIIMDLVVNHSSDEHPFFVEAMQDPDSPKREYYFFREGKNGGPPNNWKSFFSGSAWRKMPDETYALHLFSSKQMDFNWDCPALREEVADIVCWWLERGIDGFRLDVINYISKRPGLPDGNVFIGELMEFTGIEHYYYGPKLHSYLHELRQKAFEPYNAFSVGETPGIGRETGKLLTQQQRGELDMIFNFDHLETPGHVRFDNYRYDLNFLKQYYIDYSNALTGHEWLSLFFENHDNPRMSSKVNPDPAFREPLSKLLLSILLLLKGTPFLFQGQELGRGNQNFALDEFRDVESLNKYRALLDEGKSEEEAYAVLLAGSRDHSRIVMAWDEGPNGGFTTSEPWIRQDALYREINVETQRGDADSVWRFTQDLIRLRRNIPGFAYTDIHFIEEARKDYFCWERVSGSGQNAARSAGACKNEQSTDCRDADVPACNIRVEMNLSVERKALPTLQNADAELVLCNYIHEGLPSAFEPYEVRIWRYG